MRPRVAPSKATASFRQGRPPLLRGSGSDTRRVCEQKHKSPAAARDRPYRRAAGRLRLLQGTRYGRISWPLSTGYGSSGTPPAGAPDDRMSGGHQRRGASSGDRWRAVRPSPVRRCTRPTDASAGAPPTHVGATSAACSCSRGTGVAVVSARRSSRNSSLSHAIAVTLASSYRRASSRSRWGAALLECLIAICLLTNCWMRIAAWLLAIEFVGIISPPVTAARASVRRSAPLADATGPVRAQGHHPVHSRVWSSPPERSAAGDWSAATPRPPTAHKTKPSPMASRRSYPSFLTASATSA